MGNSYRRKGAQFFQTVMLKESLMTNPKTSLVYIAKIFGWHIKQSLSKEEFTDQLAEMILGNPSHVLEFQTVYELRFLKKIVEAPDNEPYQAQLLLSQLSLHDMKVLQILMPNDEHLRFACYSIASDLKEAFKPWIDVVLQKKLNQGEELLDRITMGCLNLYGIVDMDPLVKMIAACRGVTSDKKAIKDYLFGRSLYHIHQVLFDEVDGTQTTAFLSVFLDQEEVGSLMQDMDEHQEIRDYKSFPEEEVEAWGQMPFPVQGQFGAEKVYQFLRGGKLSADQAEIRVNVLWMGAQLKSLPLSEHISTFLYGLAIRKETELNQILNILSNFINHIPRWFLKGYCPSEVFNKHVKP
ncbi:hypothetical protein NG821_09880 [Prevotella cerevisiae]|uniref:Uncharacterized protein n=1 Tax=Segatella cerevisiae TaxID=2053716 RepID=A0ABT1BYI0_9BACT|nr:hypothetical protein [Segatella cerevisiae]MCO6026144.1 hypothetical protein [Segatella cerevisiae]